MLTPYPVIRVEFLSTAVRGFTQINTTTHFLKENVLTTDIDFYKRYEELNLAYYQTAMNPRDFEVFRNYVGKENIGVREEDFEVYYPED